jgi:hypothetical protein
LEQKIVQPHDPRHTQQVKASPSEAAARDVAREFFTRVTKRWDGSELLKRLAQK